MYKQVRVAAVVPARKGSKGILNKNVRLVAGHPLVAHTIMQAKASRYVDEVVVSTDSEEIHGIATSYGAVVRGLRPAALATDTAILYDVVRYEVDNHCLMSREFDLLVLLQPTSPLRQSDMIDAAISEFVDKGQISAVSVSKVSEHPLFFRRITANKTLAGILPLDSTIRRQELPDFYRVNGMIYINRIADILAGFVSFNDNLSPIVIPNEYALDIDDEDDLAKADMMMRGLR